MYLIWKADDLATVLADMENDRQMVRDTSKKRSVDKEMAQIQKAEVNKQKAEDKWSESLTQCAGLMQKVAEKVFNCMNVFSLGQINNIVHYHFGRNVYRDQENNNYHKKDRLFIEAKRLVEAQRDVGAQRK